jgi:hypothetical protein
MARAISNRDVVDMAERGTARIRAQSKLARRQATQESLSGRTFSELTPPEKDQLLQVVAEQLGLIEPEE